jgi:hypothetical protein
VTAAGYSGTQSPKKLGIAERSTLLLWRAPADLELELPVGVDVKRQARGSIDVVLAFFTDRTTYTDRLDGFATAVFPQGAVWIAWPKRASGVTTDMTDDVVREVALPRGLVDNKVCAIDATWTGLRLVWRRERRT